MENNFEDFEAIDLSSLGEMVNNFPGLGLEDEDNNEEIDNSTDSEEVIQEEVINENTEEPSSQDTNNSSPLTPYAKMLVEEGLLPNIDLDKFDGKVESLLEAQRQYDIERFESFKESTLDPRVKWLQDNLEQGVPFQQLLSMDNQKVTIESITEDALASDESLQKDILKQYYSETTNFSEQKIEKMIERLETIGDLETESKNSLQELKTILTEKEHKAVEEAKQARANQIKQQQDTLNQFKETLNKVEEVIPGHKLSPLMRDSIYKTLTVPVAVDNNGTPLNEIAKARMEDPMNFEIKLAAIWKYTDGFKDWSKLGVTGKKKAIEEFENSVKNIDLDKGNFKKNPYNKETNNYLKEMEKITKML